MLISIFPVSTSFFWRFRLSTSLLFHFWSSTSHLFRFRLFTSHLFRFRSSAVTFVSNDWRPVLKIANKKHLYKYISDRYIAAITPSMTSCHKLWFEHIIIDCNIFLKVDVKFFQRSIININIFNGWRLYLFGPAMLAFFAVWMGLDRFDHVLEPLKTSKSCYNFIFWKCAKNLKPSYQKRNRRYQRHVKSQRNPECQQNFESASFHSFYQLQLRDDSCSYTEIYRLWWNWADSWMRLAKGFFLLVLLPDYSTFVAVQRRVISGDFGWWFSSRLLEGKLDNKFIILYHFGYLRRF